MREAGARLMGRDRIGRDVFVRGMPEGLEAGPQGGVAGQRVRSVRRLWRVRARTQPAMHVVAHRAVMTLEDAIQRVSALLGAGDRLDHAGGVPAGDRRPAYRRSALASSFVAALELARQGRLEIEQDGGVRELLVRKAAA